MCRWRTRVAGCGTVLLEEVSVWVRCSLCSVWYKHRENPPVKCKRLQLRRGEEGMALGMEISS